MINVDLTGAPVYRETKRKRRENPVTEPYRGIAQLVEQRSPKPRAEGSSPSAPAKRRIFAVVRCYGSVGRARPW